MFYSRHGLKEAFRQSDIDWIVRQSMKKKIFSVLLRSGWIRKAGKNEYVCSNPSDIFKGLLDFKFQKVMQKAKRPYAFTGLSAVEVWSDYSYTQRSMERSPYFIDVLKKDKKYWKAFFSANKIPVYFNSGSTIGEFVIISFAEKVKSEEKDGIMVEPLKSSMNEAKSKNIYSYAYEYMEEKYGSIAN